MNPRAPSFWPTSQQVHCFSETFVKEAGIGWLRRLVPARSPSQTLALQKLEAGASGARGMTPDPKALLGPPGKTAITPDAMNESILMGLLGKRGPAAESILARQVPGAQPVFGGAASLAPLAPRSAVGTQSIPQDELRQILMNYA